MIGDRAEDIEAGKENQIVTIGAAYGYGDIEELSRADFIVNNPLEIINLFEETNATKKQN